MKMNKTTMTIIVSLLVQGAATVARAENEQITGGRAILSIQTYAGGAAIRYSPVDTAHGCAGTSANQYVFIDWSTDAQRKAMLALVMMAAAQGKTLGFGVDGCYGGYGGGVPLVYRVDLTP